MHEETFAGLSCDILDDSKSVIVNNEYVCFSVYLKVDDLAFFKEVIEMNK